jgi:hypothetical protein
MSDSSIPSDQSTDTDTIKLRQIEERRQARLQAQSEWRRSNTLLCDCRSCINARELKATEEKSARLRELKATEEKSARLRELKATEEKSARRGWAPSPGIPINPILARGNH